MTFEESITKYFELVQEQSELEEQASKCEDDAAAIASRLFQAIPDKPRDAGFVKRQVGNSQYEFCRNGISKLNQPSIDPATPVPEA